MKTAILVLLAVLLVAGCIQSASAPQTQEKGSGVGGVDTVKETPSEEASPVEMQEEQVAPETPSEEVNNVSVPSSQEVLGAFLSGNMYYCEGTTTTNIGNTSEESIYKLWFYYDVDSATKKIRYELESTGGENVQNQELIAISKADFNEKTLSTTVYSKNDAYAQQGCDYLKLESTDSLNYGTKDEYDASVNADVAEGTFTSSAYGVDVTSTVNCQVVSYDASVFEPKGKVCEFSGFAYTG